MNKSKQIIRFRAYLIQNRVEYRGAMFKEVKMTLFKGYDYEYGR